MCWLFCLSPQMRKMCAGLAVPPHSRGRPPAPFAQFRLQTVAAGESVLLMWMHAACVARAASGRQESIVNPREHTTLLGCGFGFAYIRTLLNYSAREVLPESLFSLCSGSTAECQSRKLSGGFSAPRVARTPILPWHEAEMYLPHERLRDHLAWCVSRLTCFQLVPSDGG